MRNAFLTILVSACLAAAAEAAPTTVADLTVEATIYSHPIPNAKWQTWMDTYCPSNRWVLVAPDKLECVEVDIEKTGFTKTIRL